MLPSSSSSTSEQSIEFSHRRASTLSRPDITTRNFAERGREGGVTGRGGGEETGKHARRFREGRSRPQRRILKCWLIDESTCLDWMAIDKTKVKTNRARAQPKRAVDESHNSKPSHFVCLCVRSLLYDGQHQRAPSIKHQTPSLLKTIWPLKTSRARGVSHPDKNRRRSPESWRGGLPPCSP